MLKKKIAFKDFNGVDREEVFYFNLTEPEVMRLDVQFPGGLATYITTLDEDINPQDILHLFEQLIAASYGTKSSDGLHFVKSQEATELFRQSAAYPALFMELATNTDLAVAFFKGIMPESARDSAVESK